MTFTSIGIDSYNDEGTVTDENISFVKARSVDTGMIITTVSMATYKYGQVKFIGSYDDFFIPSLAEFARAGHYGGAKIILQISAMGGPNTLADDVFHEIIPYVPSAGIPMYREEWTGKNTPTELKTEQIEEIIEDFIQAARRAKEAGFDGVELFAAEDFLLSSFITPHLNRRKDKYGGSFENTLRMPVEIIRGIKKICGEDFIIGFKYNAYYEFPEGDGIDLDLGAKIGKRIAEEGISYLHAYSYAKHDRPFSVFKYSIMPSQYQPRNTTIPVSEKLKSAISDVPIMAVGGILKPDEADMIIGKGRADLVSIGRAFIADHLWAYKAKRNQRFRPCIRCFVCLDEATKSRIIGCSINPDVLVDKNKELKPVEKTKNVIVAGAGPAGIIAALTASKRGHHVMLYEKEGNIGGKLNLSFATGLKYEYSDLLKYYEEELDESKIEVHLNTEVTNELIKSLNPDILIVAIGANTKLPSIPGIKQNNVINISDAINDSGKIKNKKVTVIGGSDTGCETALVLVKNNNTVTIIEQKENLMWDNDIEYLTMVLEKMLVEQGIRFLLNFRVSRIRDNMVLAENLLNKNTFNIESELIINAAGFESPLKKIDELKNACKNTFVVGDCHNPSKIFQAISEAFEVAGGI
jgi:2,4-dienoyl-CoA reductase-like NADH-dependent reductase (Old Yellow Enzyme family)/thioredoxin reductase